MANPETTKPSIPDVIADFADYYRRNPAWGFFHVVLDDGNTENKFMDGEIERAEATGDPQIIRLTRYLDAMSPSQRGRLPRKVGEYLRRG